MQLKNTVWHLRLILIALTSSQHITFVYKTCFEVDLKLSLLFLLLSPVCTNRNCCTNRSCRSQTYDVLPGDVTRAGNMQSRESSRYSSHVRPTHSPRLKRAMSLHTGTQTLLDSPEVVSLLWGADATRPSDSIQGGQPRRTLSRHSLFSDTQVMPLSNTPVRILTVRAKLKIKITNSSESTESFFKLNEFTLQKKVKYT
jgi:hypothetical protein